MKRRAFIKTAAAGLVGSAAVAAPAIAQSMPKITWRLQSSYPKSLDTIYGGPVFFAKALAEATDNNFQVQVFAAGEIVPPLGVLEAVQNNVVEAAHTAPFFFSGKNPAFAFGTAIPFGMNARVNSAWFYHGGGKALLNELYSQYNVYGLFGGHTGAQMAGFFRKEIKSLEDLKGLKFRVGGLAGSVLQRLGVVPQQIAPGDIYPALERGVIDAAEFVGPYDDEKLGLAEIAPYYYFPGFWEADSSLHFFFNKEKFEQLPANYKTLVEKFAMATSVDMLAKYDAQNPQALMRMVAAGVKLKSLPNDILEAAYKETNSLMTEISAQNALFRKIYESYSSFNDLTLKWWQVSEVAVDTTTISLSRKFRR